MGASRKVGIVSDFAPIASICKVSLCRLSTHSGHSRSTRFASRRKLTDLINLRYKEAVFFTRTHQATKNRTE